MTAGMWFMHWLFKRSYVAIQYGYGFSVARVFEVDGVRFVWVCDDLFDIDKTAREVFWLTPDPRMNP